MVVSILYSILLALGELLIYILPEWNFNEAGTVGISNIIAILIAMNDYFPVKTLFLCLASIFSFELMIIFSNIVIGFIALLRGSGKPEIN